MVNPGTDAEGGGKGTLTNTTTPGEKTEVTEPTGDPTTTVTTNPDGSTTTTTTTPTETTTTETSSSEIAGEIKDSGAPSQEEIDKVQGGWEQFVKDHGADGETVTNEDGSKSTVYTIVETSDPEASHLTAAELSTVLGVTLTQVGDDTYTYTTQNGETVTVTTVAVTDNSTETTTTKWTITVTEKSEEKHVEFLPSVTTKVDVDKDAKEILDRISNNDDGITIVAWDKTTGYVKKATEGTKTYEFSYNVIPKEVDLANMSTAEIFQFLPQDEGYRLEAGKILDRNGNELVLNPEQSLLVQKLLIVSMTVTDSHGGGVSSDYISGKPEAEATATKDAAIEAVLSAILRDVADVSKETAELSLKSAEVTHNGGGNWTVKVVIGEKTYTYSVKTQNAGDVEYIKWDAQQINEKNQETGKDIFSGSTIRVSNTAFVYGSAVIWNVTQKSDDLILTPDGIVNVQASGMFKDKTVKEVTHDKETNTTRVVTQDDGVTETYTFFYNVPLTEPEKAALVLKFGENQDYDFNGLTKTTWKVVTTSDSEVFNETLTLVDNHLPGVVEPVNDGYTYTLDNSVIIQLSPTGEEGKYSFTDGDGKTYILTVNKNVSPSPIDEKVVAKLLALNKIDLPEGYTYAYTRVEDNAAIYTNGQGGTITVYYENVADKFSMEVLESETFNESNKDALEEAIILWIMDNYDVGKDNAYEIYEKSNLTIKEDFSTETTTRYTPIAQGPMDYEAQAHMQNRQDLIDFFNRQLFEEDRNYGNPHIAVLAEFDLAPYVADQNTDEFAGRGFLLPEFNVSLYKDAEALIDNDALITRDKYKLEYGIGDRLLYQGIESVSEDDLQNAKFYKVTGTIAYDFLFDTLKNNIPFFSSEDAAKNHIDENHLDYVPVKIPHPDGERWYFCKTADLIFSGSSSYLDSFSSGGYSINLGKVVMSKKEINDTVQIPTYSATITKTTPLGDVVKGTLSLDKINTTIEAENSDISGSYQVTDTKKADSLIDENGNWLHTGIGSGWYSTYQTWVPTSTKAQDVATHEQYSGNLNYSYTEKSKDVQVDATVEKDRDVQVKLDQTSVTTVTGETSTSTTTPAPSNPGGSSGSGSSSSRPSSRPSNPSTPANPSTPENPSVNIPEEDVPLTNLPNEDVPLTDRPDETPTEQPPVTLLPEEDVPLAETPVQVRGVSAAAATRISDAQTPLADVPETGDPMLMEAFAAAAAGANALWFSMGKKRRDDAE